MIANYDFAGDKIISFLILKVRLYGIISSLQKYSDTYYINFWFVQLSKSKYCKIINDYNTIVKKRVSLHSSLNYTRVPLFRAYNN